MRFGWLASGPSKRWPALLAAIVVWTTLVSGCGLFREGTVIGGVGSGDKEDEEVEPLVAEEPAPIATPDGEPLPENAVVIGALMATTGILASYDRPALIAAQIQVDAINEAGGLLGRPVVIRHIDSHSEMSTMYNGAAQLLLDGMDLLLITCDADFAVPALRALEGSGTLVISPCGAGDRWITGELGERVFSMATPLSTEGAILASIVAEEGFDVVEVVTDRTSVDTVEACGAFQEEFEAAGGSVPRVFHYQPTDPGLLVPLVAGLVGAEAIVLCGTPPVAPEVVDAIRQRGIQAPIFANSTMDGNFQIALIPNIGDFTILSYASVYGDDPSPAVQEVLTGYLDATELWPTDGRVVTGADAISAYQRAVERAGTFEPGAVAAELERFDGEDFVAGPTSFGPDIHAAVDRPMRIIVVQDGDTRFDRIAGP